MVLMMILSLWLNWGMIFPAHKVYKPGFVGTMAPDYYREVKKVNYSEIIQAAMLTESKSSVNKIGF
jgi:hypothetical protein